MGSSTVDVKDLEGKKAEPVLNEKGELQSVQLVTPAGEEKTDPGTVAVNVGRKCFKLVECALTDVKAGEHFVLLEAEKVEETVKGTVTKWADWVKHEGETIFLAAKDGLVNKDGVAEIETAGHGALADSGFKKA
jgi:hypothetical protein